MKIKPSLHYFEPDQLEAVLEHIDKLWEVMTAYEPKDHGTLIGLPKPYIVPSSRFNHGFIFHEQYYWDSFFIAQGLYGTRHQKTAGHMLENLLFLQRRFGIIPNGNRYYYMSRSQPPFLTTYIFDVYRYLRKSKKWLYKAMEVAESEYLQVWTSATHPNLRRVHHGLSRFYDMNVINSLAEAESGWDMNPRFDNEALNYLPVDLNALLYKYEKDFEKVAFMQGKNEDAKMWSRRADRRKAAVNKLMWDDDDGLYFDYNYVSHRRGTVRSLAAYFPLWAGMATKAQAAKLVQNLNRFQFAGGLATTDKQSVASTAKYSLQWEYPNGWAPLQWVVVQGLIKYGYRDEADLAVRTWLGANLIQFHQHQTMLEKYNVVDVHSEPKPGLYPSQEGFGWTNAIFYRFCKDYLLEQELPSTAPMPYFKEITRFGLNWGME